MQRGDAVGLSTLLDDLQVACRGITTTSSPAPMPSTRNAKPSATACHGRPIAAVNSRSKHLPSAPFQ